MNRLSTLNQPNRLAGLNQTNRLAGLNEPEGIGFGRRMGTLLSEQGYRTFPFVGSAVKASQLATVKLAADHIQAGDDYYKKTADDIAAKWDIYEAATPQEIETTRQWSAKGQPYSLHLPGEKPPTAESLRAGDEQILSHYLQQLDEQDRLTTGGKIAEGMIELPAFIGEFLMTGGSYRLGRAPGRRAALRILGRRKNLARIAGALTGTAVRTAAMTPRVAESTMRERMPAIQRTPEGDIRIEENPNSVAMAFLKGYGDVYIENLSEVSGPTLTKGLKKLPFVGRLHQALFKNWKLKNPTGTLARFTDLMRRGGYHGFLEEMGEERVGDVLRHATGIEGKGDFFERLAQSVPGAEQILVEAGVFAPLTILHAGGQVLGAATAKAPYVPAEHPFGQAVIDASVAKIQAEGLSKQAERAERDEYDRSLDELDAEYAEMFGHMPPEGPTEVPETKTTKEEEIAAPAEDRLDKYARISDKALDDAYHYGLSQPGTFGFEANKQSAAQALNQIEQGETDIDKIAAAVHEGWAQTARTYEDPVYKTKPEKRAARQELAETPYEQLAEEEKEKDRVVARAILEEAQNEGLPPVAEPAKKVPIVASKPEEPEKIAQLQTEIAEREAGMTDEQLSGITKRRRRRMVKETAERIAADDIYRMELEAVERQGAEIGTGFYYVHKSGRGEVEEIIGKRKGFPTTLQKMFTFDPLDVKSGRAIAWDTAVQESLGRGKEGVDVTAGHMDLSEFVRRVKQAHENKQKYGLLNKTALERAEASGQVGLDMLAEKYRLLVEGHSDLEINMMIADWAAENDIPIDQVIDEMVNPEKFDEMLKMSDEAADAEMELIATEQILQEEQAEGLRAAKEILEANGLDDVEVEEVKEIKAPEPIIERKPKKTDLLGRPILEGGAAGTQQEFLDKEKYKTIAEQDRINALQDIEGQATFMEGLPPKPEDDIPFEMRGVPVGAAMTVGQSQIVQIALGADMETGFHEGYHILRSRLRDSDTKILERQFDDEEAEAAAFAEFARTNKAPTTIVRHVFNKIKAILNKIKSALAGRGFRTVEDIFGEIQEGRIQKTDVRSQKSAKYEYYKGLSYNEILKRQRELEGLRAAVRDSKTGKIYTGFSHNAAINSIFGSAGRNLSNKEKSNIYGRLYGAWDRSTNDVGFIDKKGNFITQKEASRRWDVLTMEDVKDARANIKRGSIKYETSNERARREIERRARINARKARLKAQRQAARAMIQPKARRTRLKIRIQDVTPPLREDLGPAAELPGPYEAAPPEARPPRKVVLDDKFYEANRQKLKSSLREVVSDKASRVMLGVNRAIQTMSSRLERIAPELKVAVRRFVYDAHLRTVQMTEDTKEFLKAYKKFSKDDQRAFKFAVMNGQGEKIDEIIERNNAREQYEQVRSVLDDIFEAGNQVGLDILYKGHYWPRMVKDFKGLTRYLQTTDKWSAIQKALDKRQEQANGRTLTDDEQAQVINTLLRGYRVGGISLSRPGPTRERTIELFDRNIERYYYDMAESLNLYIQRMVHAIGAREFFGKQTAQIAKLKAQRSRLRTSLYKLTTRIGYKRPWSQEKYEMHIAKRTELLAQIEEQLNKLKTQTMEDSVGWLAMDLRNTGRIKPEQEAELASILQAIFEPKGMGGAVRLFTKLGYIDVLSQPTVALTQLEEMGLAFYQDKIRSLPEAMRAAIGKSEIKLKDIGIEDINQYMMDLDFSSIGDKLMFMMRATDKAGKEAFINTTLAKYRAMAKRKTMNAAFYSKMRLLFGHEADQVIEDLKNDRVTDNIKFLAFCELSDVQPVSIAETPEYYARGGNWRIMYMLRNFTLRRLDLLRNKAAKMMVNPLKQPGQFVRGFADFMELLAIMTFFGVGKDFVRAMFLGRDFDEEDLSDSVVDNLLQYVMLSRYVVDRAHKEGIGSAAARELFPPTKTPDALWHDIRTGKLDRTVRSVPEIGENWYWWFGEGRAKIEDDQTEWP